MVNVEFLQEFEIFKAVLVTVTHDGGPSASSKCIPAVANLDMGSVYQSSVSKLSLHLHSLYSLLYYDVG